MVETAPIGTGMLWRKRNPSLNFLSVHLEKREIPFSWRVLSILSLWPVQSREQLINQVLLCDGAIHSLSQHHFLARERQSRYWERFSFQGHCLPYLGLTVLKEHWWVPCNLSIPKFLHQHSQTATHHLTPKTCNWKAIISSIKERLGVLHSQVTITQTFPGLSPQNPGVPQRWHKNMFNFSLKIHLERSLQS